MPHWISVKLSEVKEQSTERSEGEYPEEAEREPQSNKTNQNQTTKTTSLLNSVHG